MTLDEALVAVRASIAQGSATPTLGPGDREGYVRERARALEAALIQPAPANVRGETYRYGLLQDLARHDAFAVARSGNKWLGFIPEIGEFFLAYGESADQLTALGFHSSDALAEWLG